MVLPDVNVLVALAWPNHVHHVAARQWFHDASGAGWATTPVTELGFVRISSNASVVPTASSPLEALALLRLLCERAAHQFWPDDVQLQATSIDLTGLVRHRQVTDPHLLALASARGGQLVTFDGGIAHLRGAEGSLRILEA